jgi:hypothetical protein
MVCGQNIGSKSMRTAAGRFDLTGALLRLSRRFGVEGIVQAFHPFHASCVDDPHILRLPKVAHL